MSTSYLTESNQEESNQVEYNIILPRKCYKLRCIECEFKVGGPPKNTPYLQRTWEIISPPTILVDGETKNIAGMKIRFDNLFLTAKNARRVIADSNRLKVTPPDDEQPNVAEYIGKTCDAILETEVVKEIDEETGQPIYNSKGEPIVRYRHSIKEFID